MESILRICDMLLMRYIGDSLTRGKMQKVIDRLNKICKAYGMEINAKNTKVMIMNETAKPKGMQRCITLNKVPLEQVTRFKYLGSRIAEDARSDEDIRARV